MADEKSSTGNTKTPEFEPPQGEYCMVILFNSADLRLINISEAQ